LQRRRFIAGALAVIALLRRQSARSAAFARRARTSLRAGLHHAALVGRRSPSWLQQAAGRVASLLAAAAAGAASPVRAAADRIRGTKRAIAVALSSPTAWVAGVTGAIAVALVSLFAWMAWHSYQIVLDDTDVSSSNLAVSVEQFVARTIDTVDLSLRSAAEMIDARRPSTRQEIGAALPERVKRAPEISNLLVIDADGRLRYSAVSLGKPDLNLARAPYFKTARDSDQLRFAVGEPVGTRGAAQRRIYISRRFAEGERLSAGVIAAMLDPAYMQRFFSTLNIGEHGFIAVATTDGTMLVERPSTDENVGRSFGASVLFRDMLPWASSGVFPLQGERDGVWRVVGYQRVGRLPLVVEVGLSKEEALQNWHHTTSVQASLCALMLIVLGVMAFALRRELKARMRTVGELERARLAAETSNQVKSQFLANMSHELRTPLNAIIGFSEMIRDAIVGPVAARYREYARDIHSSGRHLVQLIGDVLDLSKIEAGRLELREELVDLPTVVRDCRSLVLARVERGGLALNIDLPRDLPPVRADALRLKQVLLNLLANAVKFTPPGGRVEVSVAVADQGGIEIRIADTGIGMKTEEIPIALEPFRQVEGSVTRRYEGTGLGLPLARTLIELHGGSLRIVSVPGKGTTVTMTLPPERVHGHRPITPGPPPPRKPERRRRRSRQGPLPERRAS
jgi:two-component system cell cycle sensor histidine kinase PleC